MPFLLSEPNVYPANLFDAEPEATERRWRVFHTKPRQEKQLARKILLAQVPFYLPLQENRSLVRGRVMRSYLPLFTSYVFALCTQEERVGALASGHAVRTLEVEDQAELQRDLAQVYQLIRSGLPLTPEKKFRPGVTVEITTGAMTGLRGTIIRAATGNRFVVRVNFLQQGVSVTIDDYAIAVVRDSA